MSHTPAPWVVADGHFPSIKEIVGPSFKISCVMWATDLTEEDYRRRTADLALIAAAPQLLQALEHIAASLYYNDYGDPALLDSFDESIIDAAIRAAKGEA